MKEIQPVFFKQSEFEYEVESHMQKIIGKFNLSGFQCQEPNSK